jgi:hypothetical protein
MSGILYNRMVLLEEKGGKVTAALLRHLRVRAARENPPDLQGIPVNIAHVRKYVQDMAYLAQSREGDTHINLKRRLYKVVATLLAQGKTPTGIRIQRKFPEKEWGRVWGNLHDSPIQDTLKSTWYYVIHDIIATRSRLADTSQCPTCGDIDTITHRITECGETPVIWNRTSQMLAYILRTDRRNIPKTWPICPDFQLCPQQKRAVVLWFLAELVHYQVHTRNHLPMNDMDFLRRARWKLYQAASRPRPSGNYLEVIDWPMWGDQATRA